MSDRYKLYDMANAALTAEQHTPKTNDEAYKDFLAVHDALMDAEVPTDGRVMYYFVWSWWRHPIKRWKQKRALRQLTKNS